MSSGSNRSGSSPTSPPTLSTPSKGSDEPEKNPFSMKPKYLPSVPVFSDDPFNSVPHVDLPTWHSDYEPNPAEYKYRQQNVLTDNEYYQGYSDDISDAEQIDREYGMDDRLITFTQPSDEHGSVFDLEKLQKSIGRQRHARGDDLWVTSDDPAEYDPQYQLKVDFHQAALRHQRTLQEITDTMDIQREEKLRKWAEEDEAELQESKLSQLSQNNIKNPFFQVKKAHQEGQKSLITQNKTADDDPDFFNYQNVYRRHQEENSNGKKHNTLPYDPLFGGKLPNTVATVDYESHNISDDLYEIDKSEREYYQKKWSSNSNKGALSTDEFIHEQFPQDTPLDFEKKKKTVTGKKTVLRTIEPDDPPQIKRERERLLQKEHLQNKQAQLLATLPALKNSTASILNPSTSRLKYDKQNHAKQTSYDDTNDRFRVSALDQTTDDDSNFYDDDFNSSNSGQENDKYWYGWSENDLLAIEKQNNKKNHEKAFTQAKDELYHTSFSPFDANPSLVRTFDGQLVGDITFREASNQLIDRPVLYDNKTYNQLMDYTDTTDWETTSSSSRGSSMSGNKTTHPLHNHRNPYSTTNLNFDQHDLLMNQSTPFTSFTDAIQTERDRPGWDNHLQSLTGTVDPDKMIEIWVLHNKTIQEAKELLSQNKYPTSIPYSPDPYIQISHAWEVEQARLQDLELKKQLEDPYAASDLLSTLPQTRWKPRHQAEKMYFNLHKMVLKSQFVHPDYYKYLSNDEGFLNQIQHSFYTWLWKYLYPQGKKLQYRLHAYPKRNGPLVLPETVKAQQHKFKQGIRIAHLTDLHYFDYDYTPTLTEMLGKRLIGYANLFGFGRNKHFSPEARADIIAKIQHLDPDIVICTGDLTSTGLTQEFELAFAELSPLLTKFPFFLIPGNHDVYTSDVQTTMPIHLHFLQYMHKIIPKHMFPRAIDVEFASQDQAWLSTIPNFEALTPDELEHLRQVRYTMMKEREKQNRWYLDEQGEKKDKLMESRILATTSDNLLNPDIQQMYPTLSLFLSKPITRMNLETNNTSSDGKIVSTITNQQLRSVAQQSFAYLPPRQLVYTQRDIDKLDINNFIPEYPFPKAPQGHERQTPPWFQLHNGALLQEMASQYHQPEEYLDQNWLYGVDEQIEERRKQREVDQASQFPPENFPTTPNNNQVLIVGLNPCRATGIGSQGNYPREQLDDLQRLFNNRKHIMNDNQAELTSSEPIDDTTMPFIILATHYPVVDRTGYDYTQVHHFHGVKNNHQLLHILDTSQVKPGLIIHGHDHLGSATGIATQRNLAHNSTNDYLYPSLPPRVSMPRVPPNNYDTDPSHLHCENDPQGNIYAPHNNRPSFFQRIYHVMDTKYHMMKWYMREFFTPSRTNNIMTGHLDKMQQQDLQLINKSWDDPAEYDITFDSAKPSSTNTYDPDIPRLPALFEADMAYTPSINDVLGAYQSVYTTDQMDSIDVALTLDELQLAQVNNAREIIISANKIEKLDPEVTREYLTDYQQYKSESVDIIKSQIGSYCHTTVPLDLQSYLSGTLQPFTLVKPPIFDPNMGVDGYFGNGLVPSIRKRIEKANASWLGSTSLFFSSLRPQLQRISHSSWYRKVHDYVAATPSLYNGVALKESINQYFKSNGDPRDPLSLYNNAKTGFNGQHDIFLQPSIFHDDFNFFDHGSSQSYHNGDWDGMSSYGNNANFSTYHGDQYNPSEIQNYITNMVGGNYTSMIHDNFQEKDLIQRHFDNNPDSSFGNAFHSGLLPKDINDLRKDEYYDRPDMAARSLASDNMGHINTDIHRRKVSELNKLELQLNEIKHSLDRYENQYTTFLDKMQSNPYLPANIKTVNTVYGDMTYSPEFSRILREKMVKKGISIEDLRKRYNETADMIDMLRVQPRGVLPQDWPDITKYSSKEEFERARAAIPFEDKRPFIPLFDAAKQQYRQVLNMRLRYNIIKILRNTWNADFLQRNTTQADALLDGIFWPFAMEYNVDRPWFDPLFVEFHRNRRLIDIPDRGKWEIPLYGLETIAAKWNNPADKYLTEQDNDFAVTPEDSDDAPFNLYQQQSAIIERARDLFKQQQWWDNYTIFREGVTRPIPGLENYTISSISPGSLTAQLLDPKYIEHIPPSPYDLKGYDPHEHSYTYGLYRPRDLNQMVLDGASMADIYQNKVPEDVLKKMGLAKGVQNVANTTQIPLMHIDELGDLDLKSVMKDASNGNEISNLQQKMTELKHKKNQTLAMDENDPFKVLSYREIIAESTENTRKYLDLQKNGMLSPGIGLIDPVKIDQLKNGRVGQKTVESTRYGLDSRDFHNQLSNTDRLISTIAGTDSYIDSTQLAKQHSKNLPGTPSVEVASQTSFSPLIFTGGKDIPLLGSLEHQFPHGMRQYRQLTELVSTQQLFDDWVSYTGAGIVDTSISAQIPVGQTIDFVENKLFSPIKRGLVHHDQARVFLHASCRHVENLRIAALEDIENQEAIMSYRRTKILDKIENEGYEDDNQFLDQIQEAFKYFEASRILVNQRVQSFVQLANKWVLYVDRIPSHVQLDELRATREDQLAMLYDEAYALGVTLDLVEKQFPWMKRTLSSTHPLSKHLSLKAGQTNASDPQITALREKRTQETMNSLERYGINAPFVRLKHNHRAGDEMAKGDSSSLNDFSLALYQVHGKSTPQQRHNHLSVITEHLRPLIVQHLDDKPSMLFNEALNIIDNQVIDQYGYVANPSTLSPTIVKHMIDEISNTITSTKKRAEKEKELELGRSRSYPATSTSFDGNSTSLRHRFKQSATERQTQLLSLLQEHSALNQVYNKLPIIPLSQRIDPRLLDHHNIANGNSINGEGTGLATPPKVIIPIHNPGSAAMAPVPPSNPKDYPKLAGFNMYTVIPRNEIDQRLIFASTLFHKNEIKYPNNGNSYCSGDYYSLEFKHFLHLGYDVVESEVPYTYPLF